MSKSLTAKRLCSTTHPDSRSRDWTGSNLLLHKGVSSDRKVACVSAVIFCGEGYVTFGAHNEVQGVYEGGGNLPVISNGSDGLSSAQPCWQNLRHD